MGTEMTAAAVAMLIAVTEPEKLPRMRVSVCSALLQRYEDDPNPARYASGLRRWPIAGFQDGLSGHEFGTVHCGRIKLGTVGGVGGARAVSRHHPQRPRVF